MKSGLGLFEESFISWTLLFVLKKSVQRNCIYVSRYCYFPVDTTYIVLFRKCVCITYCYLIKHLQRFPRKLIYGGWSLFFRSNVHIHRTQTCDGYILKYRIWPESVRPSRHYRETYHCKLTGRRLSKNYVSFFRICWKSVNLSKCWNRFVKSTFSYKFCIWECEMLFWDY
jgi:hypothetical protein